MLVGSLPTLGLYESLIYNVIQIILFYILLIEIKDQYNYLCCHMIIKEDHTNIERVPLRLRIPSIIKLFQHFSNR